MLVLEPGKPWVPELYWLPASQRNRREGTRVGAAGRRNETGSHVEKRDRKSGQFRIMTQVSGVSLWQVAVEISTCLSFALVLSSLEDISLICILNCVTSRITRCYLLIFSPGEKSEFLKREIFPCLGKIEIFFSIFIPPVGIDMKASWENMGWKKYCRVAFIQDSKHNGWLIGQRDRCPPLRLNSRASAQTEES